MISHIDPKVDYAFKRVFGTVANVPILIDLLNATLNPPPEQRIVEVTIENPFNERETWDDKLSVVDIKARDLRGWLYNIEMQMLATLSYPQRVLYYWAKIFSGQLGDGDDYIKLRKTISISFVNNVLFPDVPDFHLDFHLRSSRHPGLIFSEAQEIHLIELPKFRKTVEQLADPLEGWCYFLRNAAQLDSEKLPAVLQTPAVARAMEVLNVISQTDQERQRYEARIKAERDHRMYIIEREMARQERDAAVLERDAAEQQRAAAEQQRDAAEQQRDAAEQQRAAAEQKLDAAAKEAKIVRIHLCQRLLKVAQSPKDALLAKSADELEALAKSLEQQLGVAEA